MMNQLPMICVILMAFLFALNQSGSSVSLSSSTRSTIIRQHAQYRNAAWNGNTKLPKASSSAKSGYKATLTWDEGLAQGAQLWANQCKLAHSHDGSGGYGENIHFTSATAKASIATESTPAWAAELSYWSWSTIGGGCQSGKMCGHYTQVIWGGTKYVGCAMSNCASTPVNGKYKTVVVCQYYPQGNVRGRYPYQRGDTLPFGEVNPETTSSVFGLNLIVFALVVMMAINITCLISTSLSKSSPSTLTYQSVHTKEIEV